MACSNVSPLESADASLAMLCAISVFDSSCRDGNGAFVHEGDAAPPTFDTAGDIIVLGMQQAVRLDHSSCKRYEKRNSYKCCR